MLTSGLRAKPRPSALLGFCVTIGLTLFIPSANLAQQPTLKPTRFVRARVGLDGHYKVGYWTPVEVTLIGGPDSYTGYVDLIVADSDGVQTRVRSQRAVQTVPGRETSLLMYAKFGQADGGLSARFIAEGKLRAERAWECAFEPDERQIPIALAANDELIVSVGPSIGVATAVRSSQQENQWNQPAVHVVHLADVSQLPTRWYGYEGIDAVVLATSRPEIYRDLAPTDARTTALREWVRLGGRLVMCVGREANEILAPSHPLAGMVPGKLDRMVPLRRTSPLEGYCDTTSRIETTGANFRIDVPRLDDVAGRIEAHEGNRPTDLPLVVRAAQGLGQVVVTTVDLDRPPFVTWPGRSEMINRLLHRPNQNQASDEDGLGAVTTYGYHDLSGQLRSALDNFKGIRVVPFGVVAMLVFAYILLIGPVDYWFVKHVLKRMEATWITFPFWVVVISISAYFAAFWFKGRDLRTNQVELVDVDLASNLVRGATWTNVFSPRPDSYNLSLSARLPGGHTPEDDPQTLLSWMGLPGDAALGGMSGGTGPSLFGDDYAFSPALNQMHQVPIQVWSTKNITSRWHCTAELPLEVDLREGADQMLLGSITNRLGIDLVDARLFYDRWAYQLGKLADGDSLTVDADSQPATSKTLLTQQRIVADQDVVTIYDSQADDVPRIMEMMMFHEVVGGPQYTTGLLNRYQGFCDLSEHLKLGRAILLVSLPEGGSEIMRDNQSIAGPYDRRWTYYRFILPVARHTADN